MQLCSVELSQRSDGKFNVWAWLPDPRIGTEDAKKLGLLNYAHCWHVVDVLDEIGLEDAKATYASRKIDIRILPSKYRGKKAA